jgi:hypothetical protein
MTRLVVTCCILHLYTPCRQLNQSEMLLHGQTHKLIAWRNTLENKLKDETIEACVRSAKAMELT